MPRDAEQSLVFPAKVLRAAQGLPGVELTTSYRTAALKVRGKLFLRLQEDGKTLVLRTSFADRDFLMHAHPEIFHLREHYHDFPYVLVHSSRVPIAMLRQLLRDGWARVAPPKLLKQLDDSAEP